MPDQPNCYRHARQVASERDPRLSSRERTAELIHVSPKALSDYETGVSVPPCSVVAWMVDVYRAHDLVGEHIRDVCPLMAEYGSTEPSEISRAALGWSLAMGDAQEIARSFAQVARDGRVSRDELAAAKIIRERALSIQRVMQETVAAIDKALDEARL